LPKKTAEFKLIRSAFAESARWSRKPIDLSGLKAVDATMSIKTDRLLANKFTVDNAVIRAKISNGALSADMINASLYQGKATLNINMMADGRIDGRVSTQGVELEPLLAALSDSDRFSGKANMHLAFASQGRSVQALVSNLDGGADIRLADGSVKGVDLAGMIRNVKSAFTGAATAQRKTDFAELGGTFTIARGIITNNDLAMKAPLFRVSGKGTVDLPNYTLNYLLNPQLVDTAKGQGGADKQGLGVPIRITGSLDNPSYAPDLQEAIQDALKDPQKIKDAVKDAKELFKDKNSIKDLKGLLKGF
jgi:AsmA protein